MKDIKERVRDKNPKIRNPAARLPKELVRSAVLEAKEKPRELHEKSSGQSESPTQYGTEKIESVQYRAASVAGKTIGKTTYQGGKKLAGVTYRKIKERKSRQEEAKLISPLYFRVNWQYACINRLQNLVNSILLSKRFV